jgi:hypothetical protein
MMEEMRCPRCGIRRVGNLGNWGRFCFNCRMPLPPKSAEPHNLADPQPQLREPYVFEGGALERLKWYRAALRAGFYADWPD